MTSRDQAPLSENMRDFSTLFEKIINLKILEVTDKQICVACGLSEEELELVESDENYKIAFSSRITEELEEKQSLDNAWDTIEKQALTIVTNRLKITKDSDFALKAAVLSNKANRRHRSLGNKPIEGQMGTRAVIYLNPRFTQTVVEQKTQVLQVNTQADMPKKQQDFLGVKHVQNLLKDGENEKYEKLMHDMQIENEDTEEMVG